MKISHWLRSRWLKPLFLFAVVQLMAGSTLLSWTGSELDYKPVQPSRPEMPTGSTGTRYRMRLVNDWQEGWERNTQIDSFL